MREWNIRVRFGNSLRIFDIQSTSDQEIASNYPSIAQGALAHIPPEKAGMWAYPYPHLYDEFYGGKEIDAQKWDEESIVYTMLVGMSGVLYLSGRIDKATSFGKDLIMEGVECYKRIRGITARSYPTFPNGFVRIWEKEKAVVILYREEGSAKGLLFVWRQEGEEEIVVPVRAALYTKSERGSCLRGHDKSNLGKTLYGKIVSVTILSGKHFQKILLKIYPRPNDKHSGGNFQRINKNSFCFKILT